MPTIDITRLAEDPHETEFGIRDDTSSRGVDLEGAQITATYVDGTVEVLTWKALDPFTNGGASGDNIEMFFGFDVHELTTTRLLASLEIDLQPANSVFDTTFAMDDDPGGGSTQSSANGFPFRVAPEFDDLEGTIDVAYNGIVNLTGEPAAGDLFTTMIVDFTGLSGGGLLGDLRWNSDIDTMRVEGDLVRSDLLCFASGTLIATEHGAMPVETLSERCKVLTRDHGFQPLQSVLCRVVGLRELRKDTKLYPVKISAGALGRGLPKRDLVVSRQHRMVVSSRIVSRMFEAKAALVAAIRLTSLPGIHVDDTVDQVAYYHLVFKRHEVVFAEGAPSESFFVDAALHESGRADSLKEFATLFPDEVRSADTKGPALIIPSRMLQTALVERHLRNNSALLS